jgi:hypothetical protein
VEPGDPAMEEPEEPAMEPEDPTEEKISKPLALTQFKRETIRAIVLGIQARRRFKMLKREKILHAFVIDKAVREIKLQYSGFRRFMSFMLLTCFCFYLFTAQMPNHFEQYQATELITNRFAAVESLADDGVTSITFHDVSSVDEIYVWLDSFLKAFYVGDPKYGNEGLCNFSYSGNGGGVGAKQKVLGGFVLQQTRWEPADSCSGILNSTFLGSMQCSLRDTYNKADIPATKSSNFSYQSDVFNGGYFEAGDLGVFNVGIPCQAAKFKYLQGLKWLSEEHTEKLDLILITYLPLDSIFIHAKINFAFSNGGMITPSLSVNSASFKQLYSWPEGRSFFTDDLFRGFAELLVVVLTLVFTLHIFGSIRKVARDVWQTICYEELYQVID